jgi:hypothetical protein
MIDTSHEHVWTEHHERSLPACWSFVSCLDARVWKAPGNHDRELTSLSRRDRLTRECAKIHRSILYVQDQVPLADNQAIHRADGEFGVVLDLSWYVKIAYVHDYAGKRGNLEVVGSTLVEETRFGESKALQRS